jgi:HlyD family secretion protein
MKKLSLVLVLFVFAGVSAYAYYTRDKAADKAAVNQTALTRGAIVQAVQATGTLEPVRTVQVGSQVSGVVSALYADFNSIVKAGQVIAKLNPSLLQVQVDVQKSNIARQEGDIALQEVQLESDRTNRDRAKALFEGGLVSPQQLETAELQVKTREANIAAARKQLVQAEASLHQAELNVSYCTIVSPVDGVVVDRKVDIGQTVQASMTTPQFFTIATDLTTLTLAALVDESDIGSIRRGMQVDFTVDAYGQRPFSGTVDAVRLNAQTSNNVVTYPVWITVKNPGLTLRPSMTANLKIVVDQANDVLRVPNQALRFRPTSDMYAWLGLPAPAAGKARSASASADSAGKNPGQGPTAAAAPIANAVAVSKSSSGQIDDLFAGVEKRVQPGQVWIYDENAADAGKKLRSVSVRVGLADGQFSELMSPGEDLTAGTMIVTGVVPPASAVAKSTAGTNNLFNQGGGRGGFGGPGRFGG